MAERLVIRNFAGIEEIDIELGRINIFIGPQASGKSICVKSLYYFKGCVNSLLRQAIQPQFRVDDLKNLFAVGFITMFDPSAFQGESLLRYTDGENFIQVTGNSRNLEVTYSDFYPDLFERARKAIASRPVASPEEAAFFDTSLYRRFKQLAAEKLGLFGTSSLLFVPASRATYSFTAEPRANGSFSTDAFINTFRKYYTGFKQNEPFIRHEFHNSLVEKLSKEILSANFDIDDDDNEVLVQANGFKIPLTISSSGQQEVLPVVLTLRHLAVAGRAEAEVAIIEEPEAHLHPTAQNALAQLMAAVYNIREAPLQLFLTTHTPYLLTAFNNLVYAGQLADSMQEDPNSLSKLDELVPEDLRLHLADFRVYGLENGRAKLLIDEETGLLRADSLDSVSDITADQFGDLMALDPAIHP